MPRLPLAAVAGAALWLAFPGHDLWPLAPVGVALLALATRGARPAYGLVLGLVCGLVYFLPLLHWSGIYVGNLPWVALSVLEALYVALLGWGSALLQRAPSLGGPGRVRPVLLAALWVGQEALRGSTPFGGFPWARLAFSQTDSPLVRLAALGGAPAVTFGTALVGAVLAAAIARAVGAAPAPGRPSTQTRPDAADPAARSRTRRPLRAVRAVPGLVLAVVLLVLPLLVATPTGGPLGRFLGVQGNVPRAGLDFNAERRAVLDNHARVTAAAAAQVRAGTRARPDLVVWPENASDIDPTRNPDAAAVISGATDAIGAPLLLGALLLEPEPRLSNASLLYLPGRAGAVQRYVKQHPVPFAEYMPYRSFFRAITDKVDLLRQDFAPGHGVGLFRVPGSAGRPVAAGAIICFEVAYDSIVRETVDAGANVLVVQTNNATFGFTDESVQQLAISRLRAIEHGRSVVHVSTVGVSALITPDGTAQQRSALFTSALLDAALPLRNERTVADQVGPWPEWLVCLAVVLLLGRELLRRPRYGRRDHSRDTTDDAHRTTDDRPPYDR